MFIFSNLATSLDGKIATVRRGHFPLGTPADRRQMLVLRKRADAVIVGASTLRSYPAPMLSGATGKQPINIVVSSRLEGFSPRWQFFMEPRTRRVLFVGPETSDASLRKFDSLAEIYRLKKGGSSARQITKILSKLGVRRLLVEGGGGLMWDFVHAGLLDEINLTLTPRIVGGAEAPTLVDGDGFGPGEIADFKLKSCRRLKDELYLVYSAKNSRQSRKSGYAEHRAEDAQV
jgi:riboflavin-specific deaminase-like protein